MVRDQIRVGVGIGLTNKSSFSICKQQEHYLFLSFLRQHATPSLIEHGHQASLDLTIP